MKKLVNGLVGAALGIGCLCFGCQPTINEEAKSIMQHYNAIRDIVGLKQGETFEIYDSEKNRNIQVIIRRNSGTESRVYLDSDKDGKYDQKNIITIPKDLDIFKGIPSMPPDLNSEKYKPKIIPKEPKPKPYTYEEKEDMKNKGLFVYKN
ncbi:MAG: hypothetical protein Q8N63_02355 [Nanoarchaeota archaeon]|nr:hypothetical protein [Nanoarchaeota archaeon]